LTFFFLFFFVFTFVFSLVSLLSGIVPSGIVLTPIYVEALSFKAEIEPEFE
jgi:hypothetical protein